MESPDGVVQTFYLKKKTVTKLCVEQCENTSIALLRKMASFNFIQIRGFYPEFSIDQLFTP